MKEQNIFLDCLEKLGFHAVDAPLWEDPANPASVRRPYCGLETRRPHQTETENEPWVAGGR